MRALDWSTTDLGPPERWPGNLQSAVSISLTSRFPILIWWGPELTVLYNDAYIPFLGEAKHPRQLGRPGRECWAEIWDVAGPMLEGVRATGEATWSDDFLFFFERKLPREEVYVRFTYGPILGADGRTVEGIFTPCTEVTEQVVGARRLEMLRKLGVKPGEARTVEVACKEAAAVLGENPHDIPFAAIYVVDDAGSHATLAASTRLPASGHALPPTIQIADTTLSPWPLATVLRTQQGQDVDLTPLEGTLPGGAWPEPAKLALVLPIPYTAAGHIAAILVVGVSPRRVLDGPCRAFFDLVAGHIGTAIFDARAHEEERRRAESLAELDRAKTAFFSDVSHEFRTPLTLVLGPIDEILSKPEGGVLPENRELLTIARRNATRLQKLVNSLLDFARIEVGRIQAAYEPTDLSAFTAELAGIFRSAIEAAGLRLLVACEPLDEPAYVDRGMWEKVVFNLLSNALKFTFEGEIEVSFGRVGDAANLTVRDTGVGIAAGQIPHVFERFHRVEGTPARTHEGSGIGLALVWELVKLHGGTVDVASAPGVGSTFTVRIPLGKSHVPADQIGSPLPIDTSALGESPFVDEAFRWLPDEDAAWKKGQPPWPTPQRLAELAVSEAGRPRILWADDNADMRAYVRRLLGGRYDVEAAADGEAALEAALARPPDLVLCDVMMPHLDGFGLLRALRADPKTRPIPVILLSARAGEESRVEGLEAGADDYLVKPFGVRELLARVSAHLEIARVRREAAERIFGVYESITDGLVILDRDWRYTYMNSEAERIVGRQRRHLVGRSLWHEFPFVVGTKIEAELRRAAADLVPREFEGRNGDRWYENRVVPTDDGGLAIYFRDVTDHRRATVALRESEERFRRYFELGLIGMAITSPEKGILEINDEICRILGYTRQELLQKTWSELTHPDDVAADIAQFDRVMVGEIDGYSLDKRWLHKDGRIIDAIISARCVRREDGVPDYFVALLQDVTERKRAESERERLALLVENSNDFIGICDLAGVPTFVNTAALRMVGLEDLDQLGDATIEAFFFPEDQAFVMGQLVPRIIRDGQAKIEIRFRHFATEEPIWMLFSSFTVTDAGGSMVALATVSRDITEERRARLALAESEGRLATELEIMKRLQQVSTRLVKDGDSTGLLPEIVDTAIAITAADMGNIQLLDRATDGLRIVASRGFGPEALAVFAVIPRGFGTCGTALERGERVVVEDVITSPIFETEPAPDAIRVAGIRGAQSTPLISRTGRPVGMLSTYYKTPHVPADRELHLLDLLARQAADWIERTQAEEDLRRARDELDLRVRERTAELSKALVSLEQEEQARKELLRRVVTIQEDERRRISRELHDQMGQHLTALMLRLRLVKDTAGEESPIHEQLQWLEDHAARIGQDVHRIALELRPAALDDLGLPAALANYAEEWSRRFGIAAEVRVNGLAAERLPSLIETTIYRAVQEAMTNVVKHAAAGRLVVTLNRMRGYVSVIIEDDGKGFDGEGAMAPEFRTRLGLLGMRERVSFAGGTLAIESSPGAGTSILIRIPIRAPEEGADD